MRAMVLDQPGTALRLCHLPEPQPDAGQVRLRVQACAVCRTDLHVMDGELPMMRTPLVLGHQIVGRIEALGPGVTGWQVGDRVGVPWLGWTCGTCRYCQRGKENLCERARFTGYHLDGGYAEQALAFGDFIYPIAEVYDAAEAAPLLCGGLIGYRCYRFTEDAHRLGLYGFGAAAHQLIQLARYEGKKVYAFTRPGDEEAQRFARALGAHWAGGSDELPPEPLEAAILFAPVGALIPQALRALDRGGVVVAGGIHMSDIPSFAYSLLWEERVVRSVANLTRDDGRLFLQLAPRVPVRTTVRRFSLEQANEALAALRKGQITGSAVLVMQ